MPMVTSMALLTTLQKLLVTHVQNGDVSVPHGKKNHPRNFRSFYHTNSLGGLPSQAPMEEFWIDPIDHTRGHVPQTVGFTGGFPSQENAPRKSPPDELYPLDVEKRRKKKE